MLKLIPDRSWSIVCTVPYCLSLKYCKLYVFATWGTLLRRNKGFKNRWLLCKNRNLFLFSAWLSHNVQNKTLFKIFKISQKQRNRRWESSSKVLFRWVNLLKRQGNHALFIHSACDSKFVQDLCWFLLLLVGFFLGVCCSCHQYEHWKVYFIFSHSQVYMYI